jgi:hypothetical protein
MIRGDVLMKEVEFFGRDEAVACFGGEEEDGSSSGILFRIDH